MNKTKDQNSTALKTHLLYFILFVPFLYGAQTNSEAPEIVKAKFITRNPNAQNVKWTVFKNDCMVTYSVNNIYNESYYKTNGEHILTACNLKEDQLPTKTNQYLSSIKENTTIDAIGRVVDSKNDTMYQVKGERSHKKKRKIKYKALNLNFNSKGDLVSEGRCFYNRFPYFYRKEKIKKV